MKTRLPSAPLTNEDLQVWMWVIYRFCAHNRVLKCPINGFEPGIDRLDADLLWTAQRYPSWVTVPIGLAECVLVRSMGRAMQHNVSVVFV